jgi:uncharacterized membrane protein YhaH (DUF805 family)
MKWYLAVWQKYATFSGRARRSEYWYFILFNTLISVVLAVLGVMMKMPLLDNLYALVVLIPGLAVAVRRMHDVGKSGWYILIPIYNLVLACTDGTVGENQYGQDPKRPEFDEFLQEPAGTV